MSGTNIQVWYYAESGTDVWYCSPPTAVRRLGQRGVQWRDGIPRARRPSGQLRYLPMPCPVLTTP
eukprot:891200-Rhodomonas_salina.1